MDFSKGFNEISKLFTLGLLKFRVIGSIDEDNFMIMDHCVTASETSAVCQGWTDVF